MNFAQGWSQINPASLAIGAGSSAVGGIIGAITAKRAEKRQLKNNMKLMDYQNDINVQNWNMQNEYNTPTAQLQRYIDAGLAPNQAAAAVLGGNALEADNLASPNASVGQGTPIDIDPVGDALEAQQMSAAKAQTRLVESQADAMDIENMYRAEQMQSTIGLNNANIAKAKQEISNLEQEQKESISRMNVNDATKEQIQAATNRINQLTPIEVDQARQSLFNMQQEGENLSETFNLIKEQVRTEHTKQAADLATANAANTQAQVNLKQVDLIAQESMTKDIKNKLLSKGLNPDAADETSKLLIARLAAIPGFMEGNASKEDIDKAYKDIDKLLLRSKRIGDASRLIGPVAGIVGSLISGGLAGRFAGKAAGKAAGSAAGSSAGTNAFNGYTYSTYTRPDAVTGTWQGVR